MRITVLNKKGHEVLTDERLTTDEAKTEEIKKLSGKKLKDEFNRLIESGYTAVDDKTNKQIRRFNRKIESITMLYPTIKG